MNDVKKAISKSNSEKECSIEEIARIIAAAMKRLSAVRRPVGVH